MCSTRQYSRNQNTGVLPVASIQGDAIRRAATLGAALMLAGSLRSLAAQEPQIPIVTLPAAHVTAFGTVGIARGQTVRLNVVNASSTDGCQADLAFADSEGNLVKSDRLSIEPGKSRSLDLDRGEMQVTGNRVQVRAILSVNRPPMPQRIEVFDNETGRTTMILTQSLSVAPIASYVPVNSP
jgi:hypothetical protein